MDLMWEQIVGEREASGEYGSVHDADHASGECVSGVGIDEPYEQLHNQGDNCSAKSDQILWKRNRRL